MAKQLELRLDVPANAPRTQTPEQRWLEWAAREWRNIHGGPMTLRWHRDLALIKPLLQLHGETELTARWRAHVRTMDEFLARRGWNVPSFASCIDRYLGDQDRADLVRRWNQRRRDPLTGIKL